MAAYLQLGHDSWNLLDERNLQRFGGIVISPVNDPPSSVLERLRRIQEAGRTPEIIFDSQVYNPRSGKGHLPAWGYLPDVFDTATWGVAAQWLSVARGAVAAAVAIGADAVCSPAFVPRSFTDDYYRLIADIADETVLEAAKNNCSVLLTAIVSLQELALNGRALEIASIISSSSVDRIYLIFQSDKAPKEHYEDLLALQGAMLLVAALSRSMRVQIAFCGHDAILWKAVGAQDITSGKFLNLRRFSLGRWEETDTQGRVIPYWNDSSLITLLREADVVRLDRLQLIDEEVVNENPYSKQILAIIRSGTGKPWVGLSWRQYLYWFSTIDRSIATLSDCRTLLKQCDWLWGRVQQNEVLFIDRLNDGSWVRAWISACAK